jgi:hypothetical protein
LPAEQATDLTDTEAAAGRSGNGRESLNAGGESRTGNCKHGKLHDFDIKRWC